MFCHACRCHVTPSPPRSIWKVVNLVLWVTTLAVAVCFSSLIGLNLVLAPAAIVIGMGVGTSARRMSDWTCPRCSAELVEPDDVDDLFPKRRRLRRPLAPAAA